MIFLPRLSIEQIMSTNGFLFSLEKCINYVYVYYVDTRLCGLMSFSLPRWTADENKSFKKENPWRPLCYKLGPNHDNRILSMYLLLILIRVSSFIKKTCAYYIMKWCNICYLYIFRKIMHRRKTLER